MAQDSGGLELGADVLEQIGTLRVSALETEGSFEVIEYKGPAIPPPHVHRERDEAFYILNGSFTFTLGRETVEAPAGTMTLVRRGTRHGFTTSPGARALLIIAPAGLEGFFRELGQGLAAGKSGLELRAALAGKYDSEPAD